MSISAVILTKNEEKNIGRCLSSLVWCDEIIVVDDYSEDGTIDKIRNSKLEIRNRIKIYQKKLSADFAGQRNFGLEKATKEWILFIDGDEEISKELQQEIQETLQKQAATEICKGYFIRRKDYFGGKWLEYGETANVKLLRLAQKEKGSWRGRVHEVWNVEGTTGELNGPILHYPHQTVSEFLRAVNWYTDIVAQCWKEQGRKMSFWEIFFYPAGKFIQNYILRLGFKDGTAGFIVAVFMSFHSFLARSKYWLVTHNGKVT